MAKVTMNVNGKEMVADVPPETTLLKLLRESWFLTGSKLGCDVGDCGACTVMLNGKSVNACLVLAPQAEGANITTIEGLGTPDDLDPLQEAFNQHSSFQCGFCAPGMIVSTKALMESNPNPTELEIREALSGNLCRCTGYTKIIDAIVDVVQNGGTGGEAERKSA